MIFYDERIEQTKGKICRNAILLSTLLSLAAGGLRIANILRNAAPLYLWRASPELLIGAGGMVCLLIALIAYLRRPKDERADTEMGQLYNRMATLLLKISLCGYAVLIPVVQHLGTPMNFADSAFDSILFLLFFVIGTYVIFAFRKHDIYFNYSLMEEQHYARAVLKNIAKLLLFLAILICLSDTSAFLVMLFADAHPGFLWSYTLQLLIQFFVWGFVLSLLYALLSFLERVSYQSGRLLSPATLITLGITVLIYALYATLVVLVDRSGLTQSQATILVSYANFLKYPIRLSLLLFLSYFGYEYQKHTPNRLLNGACTLMAAGEAISVALGNLSGHFIYLMMPELLSNESYLISHLLAMMNTVIGDLALLCLTAGFCMIAFALAKNRRLKQLPIPTAVAFAIFWGVDIFLRTQVNALTVNLYRTGVSILILTVLWVLMLVLFLKNRTNERSNDENGSQKNDAPHVGL